MHRGESGDYSYTVGVDKNEEVVDKNEEVISSTSYFILQTHSGSDLIDDFGKSQAMAERASNFRRPTKKKSDTLERIAL